MVCTGSEKPITTEGDERMNITDSQRAMLEEYACHSAMTLKNSVEAG